MKKFYLILLLCASSLWSNAVPAYPGLMTTTQSDGSTVSFYLNGDEHFSFKTTEDGYLIADNGDGVLEYAYLTEEGSFRTYGMKAHNPLERSVNEQNFVASLAKAEASFPKIDAIRQQRISKNAPSRQNFPLRDSPRCLIILVSYTDVAFTTPKANFENLANQVDYSANHATGSIRDYFIECSHSQFTPSFDVYGPYTLPHERAYYGANTGSSHDCAAGQMIIDACAAADDDVNFADYDTDHNGIVDNIFVYYAGNNEAEGGPDESIWPHRSSLSYYSPQPLDGVTLADYACTSEFKGASGNNMCGIGTFCHEFSHVLGLPDFYDTDYSSGLSAMGKWDIMTSGNYNNNGRTPPTYTAYERFYLGWLTPTPLTNDSAFNCEGSYSLRSLISSNTAYLISATEHNLSGSSPNPKEFFMLEYRRQEGRDTYAEIADGMLITHIDYNSSNWSNNKPNNDRTRLGYYPVLPNRQYAYGSEHDLYPYVDDQCSFTLYGEEAPMRRMIVDIEDNDTACLFDYVATNESLILSVHDIDAYMAPAETQFTVFGAGVKEAVELTFREKDEFRMRRHTEEGTETYSKNLTLYPDSNNVINYTIDVRYSPSKVTYDEYQDNRFTLKGTESSMTKIAKFRYRNRRPIYITTPEAYDPTDITANSARLSWSFVADTTDVPDVENYGAKYYLDVYSITEGTQVETEDFENFPTMKDDWSATFDTYTSNVRKSGQRAALMSTPLDTIYTKECISDIEKFSVWISSVNSEGTFVIEVQDYESGEWRTADNITVTNTTTNEISSKLRAGFRRMRFYYISSIGSLAVDDISIQTDISINYVAKNKLLRDTTFLAEKLTTDQEYHFKVRATDIDERAEIPRYENISEFSNEVLFTPHGGVTPTTDDDLSISVVSFLGSNYYVVCISELKGDDYKLFIYNLDGVLVDKLAAESQQVILPELPVGQYIIKYTKESKGSKSDPYTKFHYTLNLK